MIVPMLRCFVACRAQDRAAMLERLATARVVQVEPLGEVHADADLAAVLARTERVRQRLGTLTVTGTKPTLSVDEAVEEADQILKRMLDRHHRLGLLHAKEAALGPWETIRLADLAVLTTAGLYPRLAALQPEQVASVIADCLLVRPGPDAGFQIVFAVRRAQAPEFPADTCFYGVPEIDAEGIAQERHHLTQEEQQDQGRLQVLAHLVPDLDRELHRLRDRLTLDQAGRGGLGDNDLFAMQGWLPAPQAKVLRTHLSQAPFPATLATRPPRPDEVPPTLVAYPTWARPIAGLFKILGSVPGYREADVSPVFMLTLPLFCAFIISDAGYALLLLIASLAVGQRIVTSMGRPFLHLVRVVGLAAFIWGVLCNSFFGVGLLPFTVQAVDSSQASQNAMMLLCFSIAALHLTSAWLWQAVRAWPDKTAFAAVGWGMIVVGIYGGVLALILQYPWGWQTPWPWLICLGSLLSAWYTAPQRGFLPRLAIGLINLPLNLVGKFSDIMSYIRLMAIGMAGTLLATTFNGMAASIAEGGGILPVFAGLVLILGHGLNFALAMIALFAHGVRLNMLEFSTNLGMTWSGHPFHPLRLSAAKD